MYCIECGRLVPDGNKFCPFCGAAIIIPDPQDQATAPAAPEVPVAPVVPQAEVQPAPVVPQAEVQPAPMPQIQQVQSEPRPIPTVAQQDVPSLQQGPTKKKKKWLPPVIIFGSIILIAGVAAGIIFGVRSAKTRKAEEAVLAASELYAEGDYEGAFDKYEEALDSSPDAKIYKEYAQALIDRGLTNRAKDILEEGIYNTDSNTLKRMLKNLEESADVIVDDDPTEVTSEDTEATSEPSEDTTAATEETTTATTTEETTTTTTTETTTTTTALDKKPMYEAYKKFLSDKKKKITSYSSFTDLKYSDSKGWTNDFKENKNPVQVALADVTGDDINDMIVILQGEYEISFDLVVYSYIDGKVKSVLKIEGIDVLAGGYSSYIVCKSKNKGELLIYTGRFDETYYESYTVYKWNGEKFKKASTFGSYDEVNDSGDKFKVYYFKGDEKIKKDEFKALIPEFDKNVSKIFFFTEELDDALTKIYLDNDSKPAGMTYKQAVKIVESKLG
ncbi:MAG: zinc-ribbon domain-containing protein [Clostridiales bacterium]|nr:zinc-ribbon domain-containing protein [Clostridiales bacterium]